MLTESIRWCRMRSDVGFVYYEGYALRHGEDGLEDTKVVTIQPNDHYRKKYKIQILDRSPYHRSSLKTAQKEAEVIYAATSR